jgi:hypothetical protein
MERKVGQSKQVVVFADRISIWRQQQFNIERALGPLELSQDYALCVIRNSSP